MRMLLIGHRGAPAHLPEHTAPGYRRAFADGADLVEPDLVPTRDGVLLVRHEPLLADTTDLAEHPDLAARGSTSIDFTWSELRRLRARERLPASRPASAAHDGEYELLRLRDVVEIAEDARGGLVLELKWDAWALAHGFSYEDLLRRELEPVLDAACLRGARVESFEVGVLDRLAAQPWVRELGWRLVVLVEDAAGARPEEEGPARLSDAGLEDAAARFAGVSVRTSLLSEEVVARAHARGLEVLTYTLRGEDEFLPAEFAGRAGEYWRELAATGVDGVFADDPAAVHAAVCQRE